MAVEVFGKGGVMPEKEITCPRCRVRMDPQKDRIDLSWAGDGPNPDAEFAGILVEILCCPSCRCQAIRPASLELPTARLAIA
jgi:hypothetical protein